MPRFPRVLVLAAAAALAPCVVSSAHAQQSTSFTYQGSLRVHGEPYTGDADYAFRLWDAESAGAIASDLLFRPGVQIDSGLFQTTLDFGSAPLAEERWMAISVRTPSWDGVGDEPPYTALPGRQPLSASPYSLHTRGLFVNHEGDRVGIGIAAPLTALHIRPTSGVLLGESVSAGGHTALQMNLSQASGGFARIQAVKSAGSEWGNLMLNPNGGRVGIGTSSPVSTLDVHGTVRATGGVEFQSQARISNILKWFRSGVTFGPIPNGQYAVFEQPVPNAAVGDIVLVGVSPQPNDFTVVSAWVSEPNMVRVKHLNTTGGTYTPPSLLYRILVIKHN